MAFGRNDQLGGQISGTTHHDFVAETATVHAPDQATEILGPNGLNLDPQSVFPSWRTFDANQLPLPSARLRPVTTEILEDGLYLRWLPPRGGYELTPVGDEETRRLAAQIHCLLASIDSARARWLAEEICMPHRTVAGVLRVMHLSLIHI